MRTPSWATMHGERRGSTVSLSYQDVLGHRHDHLTAGTFNIESRTVHMDPAGRWFRTFQEHLEQISGEAEHAVPVFVETARTYADIDWEGKLDQFFDPVEAVQAAFIRRTYTAGVATSSTRRRLVVANGAE